MVVRDIFVSREKSLAGFSGPRSSSLACKFLCPSSEDASMYASCANVHQATVSIRAYFMNLKVPHATPTQYTFTIQDTESFQNIF